jgi:magnesium-transporting ATPase (P-type)
MTVVQLYCEGELHTTLQDVSLMTSELVLAGCSLNSNSHLLPPKTPGTEDQRVGNQTECALLAFVNSCLADRAEPSYEAFRDKYKVLRTIPFNSESKKMTVALELETNKRVRVFTKGASETIIDECAFMQGEAGAQTKLDLARINLIKDQTLRHMA